MSLSVSGIGDVAARQSAAAAAWQQQQQMFSGMMSAVQSGDLSTAKQDYASLTGGRTPPAGSPMAALGAALQSGDLSGAQKAAQTIMQARGGGHHHRHVSASATSDGATSSTTTGASMTAAQSPFAQILGTVAGAAISSAIL